MVAAPLLLAAVLAPHPPDPYGVDGPLSGWYLVHYGAILLTPLLAGGAYLLLGDLRGGLPAVARWALFPFLVCYPAWEALAGLATGRLVEMTDALPRSGDVGTAFVEEWFAWAGTHWLGFLGIAAWVVFAIGGAVAHHRAGSGTGVVLTLVVGSLYPILHGGLLAAPPLLAMAVAGWLVARGRPVATGRGSTA